LCKLEFYYKKINLKKKLKINKNKIEEFFFKKSRMTNVGNAEKRQSLFLCHLEAFTFSEIVASPRLTFAILFPFAIRGKTRALNS
jgi:hypothetical protein